MTATFGKTVASALAQSKPHQVPSPVQDGVVLLCGDSIVPQPVAWLWKDWLALGKLHLLAGAPGQGKTTIALGLAATVTLAGRWPDGSRSCPGNVLIWSGEDDVADTLLPRLIAAGADRSRVYFVTGSRIDGELRPFDPARDLLALQTQAEAIGDVRLIIVDPIVSAVTSDSHKNTETRRALQPLVDLAAGMNAALLGITHLSKGGQGSDPAQRVIGSVAFTAVARVVLVAAKVQSEDGKDRRILARGKSNVGPDEGGFEYHLEQVEALPDIHASRVAWGAAVAGTARELLADPDEQAEDAGGAVELLRAELVSDAWTPAEVACKPLKEAGFSKKQIWAASKKLGVMRKKGGVKDGWYWRLAGCGDAPPSVFGSEDSAEGSQGSSLSNVESWESSGPLESSATALAGVNLEHAATGGAA